MFFVRIFRYILGGVLFRASGGFGERFINLCAENSVDIRDVTIRPDGIEAYVKASAYKNLRQIAKNSGMKIRCVSKKGLPFFVKRHKNRAGLLVAAVFFVTFLAVTSMFIWRLDVTGSENISKELVLQTVKELGIYEGALKRNIDAQDVANQVMIKLSGKVSWLAVNIKGTHAVVEIRDYAERRKDETYGEPCNIVADFDGLLLTLEVYNGQKADAEGNGVNKGDLLISGIIENRDTSAQFMEARGKITALHDVEVKTEEDFQEQVKTFSSVKSRYSLWLFGIEIPLGFFSKSDENYKDFESRKSLTYSSVKLPFAIIRKTRAYYNEKSKSKSAVIASAADEYTNSCYEKFKNTLVLSADVSLKPTNNSVIIQSNNKCIDFMGKKQRIFTE